MKVTAKIIRTFTDEGRLLAIVKLYFDDCFAIHNVKLIGASKGSFVSFPAPCHPIENNLRVQIQDAVSTAYSVAVNN